jgi:hypothetical protein
MSPSTGGVRDVTSTFTLISMTGTWTRNALAHLECTRETVMNEEYLRAKFNLCLDQAEKNIKDEEIALAIKNLERANSAMARLFGIDEGDNNDN